MTCCGQALQLNSHNIKDRLIPSSVSKELKSMAAISPPLWALKDFKVIVAEAMAMLGGRAQGAVGNSVGANTKENSSSEETALSISLGKETLELRITTAKNKDEKIRLGAMRERLG
uniref:Uncharacterized protein n=1 Tax=Trichuris muris TaxID=70415 RepID=A0A5S6QK41_TRIMR